MAYVTRNTDCDLIEKHILSINPIRLALLCLFLLMIFPSILLANDTIVQFDLDTSDSKVADSDEAFNLRYSEVVEIDVSLNEGDLYSPDGQLLEGSYIFYGIDGSDRSILKICHKPYINNSVVIAFIYLSNADMTEFTYLGLSIASEYDLNGAHWQTVAKFFDDPLSLSTEEYETIINVFKNGTDAEIPIIHSTFRWKFFAVYLKHLLNALSNEPGFEWPDGSDYVFSFIYGDWNNCVSTKNKIEIFEHIEEHWDNYSFEVKSSLMQYLNTGNSQAMGILAELIIKYLNDFQTVIGSDDAKMKFLSIDETLKNVIGSFDLEPSVRHSILQMILERLNNYPLYVSHAIKRILYDVFIKYDGILLDFSDYETNIVSSIEKALALNYSTNEGLSFCSTEMALLVSKFSQSYPELEVKLTDLIDSKIAGYITQTSDSNYYLGPSLLLSLKLPISSEVKKEIEELILPDHLSHWPLVDHIEYLREPNIQLGLSEESSDIYFSTMISLLINWFETERPAGQGNWGGYYDNVLCRFIRFLKAEPSFSEYAVDLYPLLEKFNPIQAGESESEYNERLLRIKNLWLEGRIFLYDLNGGVYKQCSEYIDVISDFSSNFPDWLDVVILATVEGGEAYYGGAQFNWQDRYTTPYLLGESLLHEGAHALHLKHEDYLTTRLLDVLLSNWVYENQWGEKNYVSDYSKTNIQEYFAEFNRYWFLNTRKWFYTALENYSNNKPGMLNMMMYIWHMDLLASNSGEPQLVISTLGENGLLEKEYISTDLNNADIMKCGTVTFKVGHDAYSFLYDNYRIVRVDSVSDIITGMPDYVATTANLSLTVNDNDITAYKYKIDDESYSGEISVVTPINIGALSGGMHSLSILYKDAEGVWNEYPSISRFHVYSNSVHELSMESSWNLVSVNNIPENKSINITLGSIMDKIVSVWAYTDNKWLVYDPENPDFSDLTELAAGKGYWLNMYDAAEVSVSGFVPSESIALDTGWNLVGFSSSDSVSTSEAIALISGNVISVWAFIDEKWLVYDPANPDFSDLTVMEPGYGYWFNMKAPCLWEH